jgi:hypothetical protein
VIGSLTIRGVARPVEYSLGNDSTVWL